MNEIKKRMDFFSIFNLYFLYLFFIVTNFIVFYYNDVFWTLETIGSLPTTFQ